MRQGRQPAVLLGVAAAVLVGAVAGVGWSGTAASQDTIQTVVGTGTSGYQGIGGQGREVDLIAPTRASATPGGGIVWVEPSTQTVRAVGPDGIVVLVAGTPGRAGRTGDGGRAVDARLDTPGAAIPAGGGSLLIADTNNDRIRRVDAKGVISTVAGTGSAGYSGDGGPATGARLRSPVDVSILPGGGFLIADFGNNAVRRVSAAGAITTIAGGRGRGFSGDGGDATAAQLSGPTAAAVTADGGFLVADTGNDRIRKIAADGKITTVAGNGTRGFAGDGGPATSASLSGPRDVAVLPDGGFLIADTGNHRIRRVAPDGTITTVAGSGSAGFSGDGGVAASARLSSPSSVAVTTSGGFLIADTGNNRIRFVGAAAPPRNVAPPTVTGDSRIGGTVTALAGGWRGTGPAISYRWQRCEIDGPRCASIANATESTYRVRKADFGSTLRARVTATNAAGSAVAFSPRVGVGNLVRQTFFVSGFGTDDASIRGVVRPGSAPRVVVESSKAAIEVSRRRLGGDSWEASRGVLRYDTSTLGQRLHVESASLTLDVLRVRSDDRRALVVHSCPGTWPLTQLDFRALAPPGGTRIALKRFKRGPSAISLDPKDVSLTGATELCLSLSGGVPRGQNLLSFGARELSKERSALLVVTYRVR